MKYDQNYFEKNIVDNKNNHVYTFVILGVVYIGIIFFCLLQLYYSLSVPLTKVIENNYLFQPYQPPQTPFYEYILIFILIDIFIPLLLFILPFFIYGYIYSKNNSTFESKYKRASDFRLFFQTLFIIIYILIHLLILHNSIGTGFLLFVNIINSYFIKTSFIICLLFYNTGAILSKHIFLCKRIR